jgi:hypothetical protein
MADGGHFEFWKYDLGVNFGDFFELIRMQNPSL